MGQHQLPPESDLQRYGNGRCRIWALAVAAGGAHARGAGRRQIVNFILPGEVCDAYAEEIDTELLAVEPDGFDALALGSKLSAARLTRTWLMDCINVLAGNEREGS